MNVAEKILSLRVPTGSLGVVFMGQAGFILKSSGGELLGVDLYLSNCCERYFGFKRLMPKLLLPGELELDHLLASHAHYDHFDPDSIPVLLDNGRTHLYMAADCEAECKRLSLPEKQYTVLHEGEWIKAGDFDILPVPCDHGKDTPDALGFYIRCGAKHFYLAGDTCFRQNIAEAMAEMPIDLCAAPINGAFGNLNAQEGAEFFHLVKPKLCVPCHYWNFAQHFGDPNAFIEAMEAKADHPAYRLMVPGEAIVI